MKKNWWKESIVYQIYPKSFNDSNGDGIGDIRGIIEKLDYLKELGVNVLWISPMLESPQDDNGYDISDYRRIYKDYGTMQDYEELLFQAHERGIKVLILGNHTDHIHTETVDSLVTPEFHHIVNFLAHFLIFPVQIRLFFGKQVQVIHLCLIVVFPCRTAECTTPVIWLFSVYRIFPDVIVTVRIILGLFALQEPLMFV